MCKRVNFVQVCTTLASLAVVLLGCDPIVDVVVPGTILESEYSFDPRTVQQSIADGRGNVFRLEKERRLGLDTPEPDSLSRPTLIPTVQPVEWTEADFERVVQTSVELLGKESISNSRIFAIWFRTPCQYASRGPQLMTFSFFEALSPQGPGNLRYFERSVEVNNELGRLRWLEWKLSEVEYGEKKALDRSASYIPAEVALRIAESLGGANVRAQLNNSCTVYGNIVA